MDHEAGAQLGLEPGGLRRHDVAGVGNVTRLQMACRVVTEDFVYPTDKHGNRYGWGWALLTTPERLFGSSNCSPKLGELSEGLRSVSPDESRKRLLAHLRKQVPQATEKQLEKLIG